MREDGDGRNLPGQQYPKGRARRACYQPRHRDVVLEDCGDVDLGEGALGENNEQTGLTAGTIADDDELATDLGHSVQRRNGVVDLMQ